MDEENILRDKPFSVQIKKKDTLSDYEQNELNKLQGRKSSAAKDKDEKMENLAPPQGGCCSGCSIF